jgi:Cryptococcal mannosyltransferase 1
MSKSRLALTNAVCFMRSLRRRRVRTSIILLFLALAYFILILPLSLQRGQHVQLAAYDTSIAHLPRPRVFIAAMLANCAPLLSNHWIPSLLGLIEKLGHENVFVSILENGSVDETRSLLMELQTNLTLRNVSFSFMFEEDFRDGVTFQKEGLLTRLLGKEGSGDNWIMTDKGWFPRRISYLAQLRNMVLDPLKNSSRRYDKILFINDVIFSVFSYRYL